MNSYKIEFLSDPTSFGVLLLTFDSEDYAVNSLSITVEASDTKGTLIEKLSLLIKLKADGKGVISTDDSSLLIQTPANVTNLVLVSEPHDIISTQITKITV